MPDSKARSEPMPAAFKDFFNRSLVEDMAVHLHRVWPAFDRTGFATQAMAGFAALELKQRSNQIAATLGSHLPAKVTHALKVIIAALRPLDAAGEPLADKTSGLAGWAVLPLGEYVAVHGLDHPKESLEALRALTIRSTSEFAIRPFILKHPDLTLRILKGWAKDTNHHVRRLVSEGARPRLPWGLQLKPFVKDPAPVLPLLRILRDDPSEYVRRSVANNLNDMAKDHPDLVAGLAADWLKDASRDRARLVRHGCRTLIKAGHRGALAALGFAPVKVELLKLSVTPARLVYGNALTISVRLKSAAQNPQNLVLDYVIHHRKKSGTSPKVFKWKTLTLAPGAMADLSRRHVIRPITTRVYYPGVHKVEIMVNGQALGAKAFTLVI